MSAGFDYAEGAVVVPLDGDLQNDPADIGLLLDKLDEGYDVVSGWRKDRKDNLLRRIPSRFANSPDRLGDRASPTRLRLHPQGIPGICNPRHAALR